MNIPLRPSRIALLTASFFILTCLLWYGTTLVRFPTGFLARYHAGPEWASGTKLATIDERVSSSVVRRNWSRTDEPFSVRWDGYLVLNRAGVYRFSLLSDDGTRLYFDDRLVIDNGGEHGLRQLTAEVPLDRGVHTLRLDYSQAGGQFGVELLWAPRRSYSLSSLAGSVVSPRRPSRSEFILRGWRDRIRIFVVGAWALLYLSLLLAYGVVPALRALIRHHAPGGVPASVIALLTLSAGLYLTAFTWGLPGQGWASDELTPGSVFQAVDAHFSHGWWSKYPPAHYYLLTIASAPFLAWRWLDPIAFGASLAPDMLFVMFRCVSVAMAVSIVLMVYLCGSYLYNTWSALVGAAVAALTMPVVFYAKLANVDLPFVWWFGISLVSFARIAVEDSKIDYILFALAGTLAVCTKDQAYGLYGVPVLALGFRVYSRTPGPSPVRRLAAMIRQRHLLAAAGLSLAAFAVCHNLLFNAGGFSSHVRNTSGRELYRMFEPTIAGQWQLWRAVWIVIRVSFGWPTFLLCVSGLALSFWRPEKTHKRLWWLLLPAVSYYITFLAVIGYTYDRFLLPIFVVLALAGGFCASRVEQAAPHVRNVLRAGIVGVLTYSFAYVMAVNMAMLSDSRYAIEAWIRSNVEPGATIGLIGTLEHVPRINGVFTRFLNPTAQEIRSVSPEYVVVNADWVRRFQPGTPEHDGYRDLREGRLGYRPAFESYRPVSFAGMSFSTRFEPFGQTGYSTLTRINPPMLVFRR